MYILATTTTLCEGARIRSNCNSSISYCQPAGSASRAVRLYGKPDQPQSTHPCLAGTAYAVAGMPGELCWTEARKDINTRSP